MPLAIIAPCTAMMVLNTLPYVFMSKEQILFDAIQDGILSDWMVPQCALSLYSCRLFLIN